ncbi:MAG: carboxyl-terminal processing protease [Planctomycetota bacterium]
MDRRNREFSDARCRELDPAVEAAFLEQGVFTDRKEFRRAWRATYPKRIREDLLQGEFKANPPSNVIWGMIGPIGYINVRSMGGFSPSDDLADDVQAINGLMSSILTELANCDGVILDITMNTGGYDGI